MKAYLVIIPLCLFIAISWALFIFILYIFSEENFKLESALDDIHAKVDYLNDASDILWNERIFEKEMRENLAYYLPEGFSSKVRYMGLTPLDFEFAKARVYFIHRGRNYKVDFSYSFEDQKLKINRESPVDLVK